MIYATKTKKEPKTVEQMFDIKSKSIQKMAERKLSSMETANALNAAKDLVIAFPDDWKKKLDEVILCASYIVDIKEDNFIHSIEMIKKLRHGGIINTSEDIIMENRKYKEDYPPAEPFK